MLARGWERQLDALRSSLFYDGSAPLSAARYHAWLGSQAVSYIALPDATLDYSALAEARVLRARTPSYLREVWRSAHWRLFAVRDPQPIAQAPARLLALGHDSLALALPRAGSYTVRVHFTPYWALAQGSGCVSRAGSDWTRIDARAPGEFRLVVRFSFTRIFDSGRRCS